MPLQAGLWHRLSAAWDISDTARTAATSGPPSRRSWRWTTRRPCSASTCPTWTWTLYRAGVAAAVRGRAGLPGPVPAMAGRGPRLRRDPVDAAAGGQLRPQGLTGRPGRLGAGEMARLGRLRRGHRPTFSPDFLLTVVTLYWATQTMASSMRDYVDNRSVAAELSLADAVTVPTAVAVFHQFIDDGTPPREWAERLYDIRRWTPMPRGGHFPSAQQTESSAATSPPSSTTSALRPARNDASNRQICSRSAAASQPQDKRIFGDIARALQRCRDHVRPWPARSVSQLANSLATIRWSWTPAAAAEHSQRIGSAITRPATASTASARAGPRGSSR